MEELKEEVMKYFRWRKRIAALSGLTETTVTRNLHGYTKEVNPKIVSAAKQFLKEQRPN